jgi:hypothetical protein
MLLYFSILLHSEIPLIKQNKMFANRLLCSNFTIFTLLYGHIHTTCFGFTEPSSGVTRTTDSGTHKEYTKTTHGNRDLRTHRQRCCPLRKTVQGYRHHITLRNCNHEQKHRHGPTKTRQVLNCGKIVTQNSFYIT